MYDYELSNLIISRVVSITTMYNPEKVGFKKRNRKRWALVIKYEGETVYTTPNRRIVSDINHVVMLPKGCSYGWECTKSGHFTIVEFESDLILKDPICFSVKHGEAFLKMFKDLEHKVSMKGELYEIESIRDIYSIILKLVRASYEKYVPSHKRQKIQPAIEYIHENYNKNVTNDSLASVSGMSTVYFRKMFTEVMGISPINYTKQIRIEKAKEMLKSDFGTLSDIARSLGYSSLYDFSRDFKKHTGVAPSKY